jgi:hypothetical protein
VWSCYFDEDRRACSQTDLTERFAVITIDLVEPKRIPLAGFPRLDETQPEVLDSCDYALFERLTTRERSIQQKRR